MQIFKHNHYLLHINWCWLHLKRLVIQMENRTVFRWIDFRERWIWLNCRNGRCNRFPIIFTILFRYRLHFWSVTDGRGWWYFRWSDWRRRNRCNGSIWQQISDIRCTCYAGCCRSYYFNKRRNYILFKFKQKLIILMKLPFVEDKFRSNA